MEEKICCVTGHRDIPATQTEYVRKALQKEIDRAIADGYMSFMSGFADGVDLYFADAVAERKKENPALKLYAVIPVRARLKSLKRKPETNALLNACDEIVVIMENYLPSVYAKRNRYLVEHSRRVIAVYDGREKGGTVGTIRLAHTLRREIHEIPVGKEIIKP